VASLPSLLGMALDDWSRRISLKRDEGEKVRQVLNFIAPGAAADAKAAMGGVDIGKVVEGEIIPRLMLAHSADPVRVAPAVVQDLSLGPEVTEQFSKLALGSDSESLMVYVGGLLQRGLTMEGVYVGLLAPAARRIGEYWDDDQISFTDVTIALGRLQQVIRTLGWRLPPAIPGDHGSRSAFFAPIPGEQHTFGLFIIEDYFRRAGWRTWIETQSEAEDTVDTVHGHWFDVIGLGASGAAPIDDIASTVASVRSSSRNPDIFVLVGGRLFMDHPEYVAAVGADATAADGGEALLVADKAVMRLASAS